jgi:uncharacterized protein
MPNPMKVSISIKVQPKASRNEIAGYKDGFLKIRVQAPPDKGAANEAVIKLLAARLQLPRKAVSLKTGLTGRTKRIEIEGLTEEEVTRRLSIES